MNCGRSSSVEWKLPKLQRRVRFPSPAPPPPGYAPGGFVMPASRPPSTECGGAIGQNSPHASWAPAIPVQNSPRTPQNADFGPFCASRENFVPLPGLVPVQNSPRTPQNADFGPFRASRENFVPLPGLVPVQNSPRTRPWQAHPVQNSPSTPQNTDFGPFRASRENFVPLPGLVPVQNSPSTPQNADFGPICASRENFVPLPPPTRRAGRNKSRTNTPPHPSNAPSPNFACNSTK